MPNLFFITTWPLLSFGEDINILCFQLVDNRGKFQRFSDLNEAKNEGKPHNVLQVWEGCIIQ